MKSLEKHFYYCMACLLIMLFLACAPMKELIVLVPEGDGTIGSLSIKDGGHSVILDSPLAAAKIDSMGYIKKTVVTGEEVRQNFAEALAAQPAAPVKFILYFMPESTTVDQNSQVALRSLFAEVAKRGAAEVQITGHTDRFGKVEYNDRLSLERARAVQQMLIHRGLKSSFIRTVGRGEREPLVPTPDEVPEPRNRRVEVIVR